MDSCFADSVVLNTEYMKLNKTKDVQQSGHRELSTDQIRQFCISKMRNSELRAACEGYGMKPLPRESNEDLRSRILDYFETNASIEQRELIEMNKLFPSFTYTNGGYLLGFCEHGIVYYAKFLVRGEGSRDVLDALLSFKKLPRFVIYDDAGRLAEHAKKRLSPERFLELFGEHGGRVLSAQPESLAIADEVLADARRSVPSDQGSATGTRILYDRFHQNNSKNPYAKLRYMDLEKELKDVGSQHAEKFNRTIRPFTRSLNMYSAPLAYNMLRRIISAMNIKLNESIIKKQSKGHLRVDTAPPNDPESTPVIEDSSMFEVENNNN